MKYEEKIINNILKYCNDNNIKISDLATIAGYTEKRLNVLLDIKAKRRFTIADIQRIAVALNVDIMDLLI